MLNAAFTVVSLGLAVLWLIGRRRDEAGRTRTRSWAILLASVVPWLLVEGAFLGAAHSSQTQQSLWGDVRLSLDELRVAPGALSGGVHVGPPALASTPPRDASPTDARRLSDIAIPGVPPRLLSFVGDASGVRVLVHYGENDDRVGVVGAGDDNAIVGAVALQDGDVICLAACEGPGGVRLTFAGGKLADSRGAPLPPLPHRLALHAIPAPVGWSPQARVFPLRDYGKPQSAQPALANPCVGRILCLPDGAPVRSVLFQGPGIGQPLQLLLLDPGARLERGGKLVATTANGAQAAALSPGAAPMAITFYKVSYGDPDQPLDDPKLAPSFLAEARALTARVSAADGLVLTPRTPISIDLRRAELATALVSQRSLDQQAGLDPSGGLRLDLGAPDAQAAAGVEPRATFALLGGRFADSVEARLTLPASADLAPAAGGFRVDVRQSAGRRSGQPYGAPFWIGDDWQARITVERIDPQWGVLSTAPWMLAASLLLALVELDRRRVSPTRWMIASAAEYLLALRLLVAVGGAYVDGGPRAAFAIPDALAAFVAAPMLLSFAPGAGRRSAWASFLYTVAVLLALVTLIRLGALDMTIIALTGLVLLAAALRIPLGARAVGDLVSPRVRAAAAAGGRRASSIGAGVARRAVRVRDALESRLPPPFRGRLDPSGLPGWAVATLVGAVAVRILLGAASLKESAPVLGARLSLSLIYVPITLIGFAGILAAARRDEIAERPSAAVLFLGLLTAADLVVAYLVQDNGFAIFCLPMALLAWFVHWRHRGSLGWSIGTVGLAGALGVGWWLLLDPPGPLASLAARGLLGEAGVAGVAVAIGAVAVILTPRASKTVLWGAPALAAVTLLAALHATQPTDAETVARIAARHDVGQDLALLRQFATADQNALRVLDISRPDRVHETGTRAAEEFVADMAHLARYTEVPSAQEGFGAWGVFGRGFLNLDPPTVLAPYQFDDNVSAIHLIAPFGRAGAAALLVVLWTLAALVHREQKPAIEMGGAAAWRPVAAELMLWTVALVATYMILANLQFAPFTGKNVYFLAATSLSDLAEGSVLMGLALLLTRRRDD